MPIFSSREAQEQRLKQRRDKRQTPRWPSHMARYKKEPASVCREDYTVDSYRRSIHSACESVNAAIKKENAESGGKQRLIPFWSPNQLRHAWATRVRKQFGIDAASVGLGHSSVDTTLIHAERSIETSKAVAAAVG